jgi:hypothetical protein
MTTRIDMMRDASGHKPNPSFALCCSQVAREMEGVALKTNTISFSTVYDAASSRRAEMFHYAMRDIAEEKSEIVNKIAPRLLSSEDVKAATLLYPQFHPVLGFWAKGFEIQKDHWMCALYGEAASLKRDFVHYIMNLIILHPDFRKVASKKDISRGPIHTLDLSSSLPESWSILEQSEVTSIALTSRTTVHPDRFCYNPHVDYAYSAAAVAIDYLRSLPEAQRRALGTIILTEDHKSVAHPESHARGLIPYCQQYRNLRVKRHVSF